MLGGKRAPPLEKSVEHWGLRGMESGLWNGNPKALVR
jgi:hypothetical protein